MAQKAKIKASINHSPHRMMPKGCHMFKACLSIPSAMLYLSPGILVSTSSSFFSIKAINYASSGGVELSDVKNPISRIPVGRFVRQPRNIIGIPTTVLNRPQIETAFGLIFELGHQKFSIAKLQNFRSAVLQCHSLFHSVYRNNHTRQHNLFKIRSRYFYRGNLIYTRNISANTEWDVESSRASVALIEAEVLKYHCA